MVGRDSPRRALLGILAAWWNKPDKPMEPAPLLTHLAALRRTLMICVLAVFIAFLAVFLLWSKELVQFVTTPLTDLNIQVIFTGVSEAFTAQTKLSLIAGAVVASPVILVTLWLFLRPALRRKERVLTGACVLAAIALFVLGVWFAYRVVLFLAVNFFVYSGEGVAHPLLSLGTYVSFLFSFLLPFGVMFELPVVVVALTRLGLITHKSLNKSRKYVIFAISIIAAILTPPDAVSQILLALPLWALYEVGTVAAWLVRPRDKVTLGQIA